MILQPMFCTKMTNMPLLSYCKSMKSLSQNRKKVRRESEEDMKDTLKKWK